jgi:hypothetical protein
MNGFSLQPQSRCNYQQSLSVSAQSIWKIKGKNCDALILQIGILCERSIAFLQTNKIEVNVKNKKWNGG